VPVGQFETGRESLRDEVNLFWEREEATLFPAHIAGDQIFGGWEYQQEYESRGKIERTDNADSSKLRTWELIPVRRSGEKSGLFTAHELNQKIDRESEGVSRISQSFAKFHDSNKHVILPPGANFRPERWQVSTKVGKLPIGRV
jgi:hypothetical protein